MIWYEARQLHEYILNRGDLLDPTTRQRYQYHELMRLDRMCHSNALTKNLSHFSSIFEADVERISLRDYLINEIYFTIDELLEHDNDIMNVLNTWTEETIPAVYEIRRNMDGIMSHNEIMNVADMVSQHVYTTFIASKYPEHRTYLAVNLYCVFKL